MLDVQVSGSNIYVLEEREGRWGCVCVQSSNIGLKGSVVRQDL